MKILLLGSNDRAALATARALGNNGHLIENIYFSVRTPLNYSKYINQSYYIGNPYINYTNFKQRLIAFVENEAPDSIFPTSDISLDILFDCKEELRAFSKLIIPNERAYRLARNKHESLKLAEELSIPFPKYKKVQILEVSTSNYPLYIKPIYSSLIQNQTCFSFSVNKVQNPDELEQVLRDSVSVVPVMLQTEIVGGYGIGVNVFARNGKIKFYTVNKRLHEPLNGGGSSYRVSVDLDNKLEEYVNKLVLEMSLSGAMMFEFKATNNDYYLMEINPRVWGSLPLSIFSGVNFPELMLDIKPENTSQYQPGKYARHFLKDSKWIFLHFRKTKSILLLFRWMLSFGRLLLGKEKLDVEKIFDLKPGISQYYILIGVILLKTRLRLRYYFLERTLNITPKKCDKTDKVLFVCKGNIIRSAFSKHYLNKNYPQYKCDSAGTLLRRHRMTTKEALKVGKHFDINLEAHRSKVIFDLDLKEFDIIFVYDLRNYVFISDAFPQFKEKIRFLGMIRKTSKVSFQLKDPYGKKLNDYELCFQTIKTCIDFHFGEAK